MAIRIGLVGTGTVGGGCLDVMKAHAENFKRQQNLDIELVQVCSRNPEQAQAHGVTNLFTDDYHNVVTNPEVDVVIELMGGTTIARDVVLQALENGKHVVTANKALLATYWDEIMDAAARANREIRFEASVGGGIPIIDPLKNSLNANNITSMMGIVNGTTNYMLTKMTEENLAYDTVLAQAQAKGFAEADPTADVGGFDAAAKIAILANIAWNTQVNIADVSTEGITEVTPLDLRIANDMNCCIKLLAHAHKVEEGIDIRVHPTMLPKSHPLANVNGVFNAIYVVGDFVGETMFYGQGAGSHATASAVMADVLAIARHMQEKINPAAELPQAKKPVFANKANLTSKYYVRMKAVNNAQVLAASAQAFANAEVPVVSVVQEAQEDTLDLVYVTDLVSDAALKAALEDIANREDVLVKGTKPVIIRIEE